MNKINISLVGCDLPSLKNGNVAGTTHYGGSVEYSCEKNYKLVNGDKRVCQYGGDWSQPTPFCRGKLSIDQLIFIL